MTTDGQQPTEGLMMCRESACRILVALCAIAAPMTVAPASAAGRTDFNGTWSVLIVTDKGPCDRAYRYPVRVANGRVSYAAQGDLDVAGQVRPIRAVRETVSPGSQRASGTGRLSGPSGHGA